MSTLSEQIAVLRANLEETEKHVKSLESGRKSASAKARSNLMKLKSQSHQLRKSVMEHTKSLPVKTRTKLAEIVTGVETPEAIVKPKRIRKKAKEVEPGPPEAAE
jgi:hypothetical protein